MVMDKEIRKTVGRSKQGNPLDKLKKINEALKKLGCCHEPESPTIAYRKIVGRR